MWNARREADWQAVLDAAERVEIDAVLRRLGYLLSVLGIEEKISERIREKTKNATRRHLDPTASKDGAEASVEYGLIINRAKDELLAWMDH